MLIDHKKKEKRVKIPSQTEDNQEYLREPVNHINCFNLVVLGGAVLILLLFFFFISAFISSKIYRGLGIMTVALVMRICMDFATLKKRQFPIDEALKHYKQQLISYYETRKCMHFIMTPLLLVTYTYGFALLLSIFEQELLGEFYAFSIYSSWTVFTGLIILTGVQLRTELEILKSLITDDYFHVSAGIEK